MEKNGALQREHPLLGLLNHNLLPLIGRDLLLDQLVDFVRTVARGEDLGLCLVSGEGGVGKTRLTVALIERLQGGGILPLRIRFYPESELDVSRLSALALDSLSPDSTPNQSSSPMERLRRWSLTRQTVLIFEDAHLLQGEAIGSLGRFLHTLSDLPLPVLLLTRPLSDAVRGVIEPHRRQEIELEGLGSEEIAELWRQIFGTEMSVDGVEMIHSMTAGNPLALRSGFRLTAETLISKGERGESVERDVAEHSFRRSADLLAEGLIAHLTPSERSAAEKIAPLGEVFDIEIARNLLGEEADLLNMLRFKGVCRDVGYGEVRSLTGIGSDRPALGFSHTLIHGALLQSAHLDPAHLMPLLTPEVPIYAYTPLRTMRGKITASIPPDALYRSGRITLQLAYEGMNSGDHQTSNELLQVVEEIWEKGEVLDPEDRLDLEINLCRLRLNDKEGWKKTKEFRQRVDDALDRYENLPSRLLRHRIGLARYRQMLDYNQPIVEVARSGKLWEGWREVQSLIKQTPDLRSTSDFARFLGTAVQVAIFVGESSVLSELEREVEQTLALPDLTAEVRGIVMVSALARLIRFFDSEETFQLRMEQITMIEREFPSLRVSFERLQLMLDYGSYTEAQSLALEVRTRAEREGVWGLAFAADVVLLIGVEDPDTSVEENIERIEGLWISYRDRIGNHYRKQVCELLLDLLIVNNRPDLLPTLQRRWGDLFFGSKPNRVLYPALLLDQALLPELLPRLDPASLQARLLRFHLGIDSDLSDQFCAELRKPLLRQIELVEFWVILTLVDQMKGKGLSRSSSPLRSALAKRALSAVAWLVARNMPLGAETLLQKSRHLLATKVVTEWEKQIEKMKRTPLSSSDESVLLLSVVGSFSVSRKKGERKSLRGGRLHAISGALVAAELLRERLDRQDFMELASGEAYSRQSRKVVNTGMFRLREVIGRDAILTDEKGLPRLNLKLLRVDLLQMEGLMEEGERAFGEGRLARAGKAMEGALEIAAKGPLFPGLYDPLFDRLRDDHESRLRENSLRIGRALVDAGAFESGMRIARAAYLAMPGDEELSELVQEALENHHHVAEAEVIKKKELRDDFA